MSTASGEEHRKSNSTARRSRPQQFLYETSVAGIEIGQVKEAPLNRVPAEGSHEGRSQLLDLEGARDRVSNADVEAGHTAHSTQHESSEQVPTDASKQSRSARIARLRQERDLHIDRCQELEITINDAELACGRMLQQVLDKEQDVQCVEQEMARLQIMLREQNGKADRLKGAIRLKRRHMEEDRERLSEAIQRKEEKTQELLELIRDI